MNTKENISVPNSAPATQEEAVKNILRALSEQAGTTGKLRRKAHKKSAFVLGGGGQIVESFGKHNEKNRRIERRRVHQTGYSTSDNTSQEPSRSRRKSQGRPTRKSIGPNLARHKENGKKENEDSSNRGRSHHLNVPGEAGGLRRKSVGAESRYSRRKSYNHGTGRLGSPDTNRESTAGRRKSAFMTSRRRSKSAGRGVSSSSRRTNQAQNLSPGDQKPYTSPPTKFKPFDLRTERRGVMHQRAFEEKRQEMQRRYEQLQSFQARGITPQAQKMLEAAKEGLPREFYHRLTTPKRPTTPKSGSYESRSAFNSPVESSKGIHHKGKYESSEDEDKLAERRGEKIIGNMALCEGITGGGNSECGVGMPVDEARSPGTDEKIIGDQPEEDTNQMENLEEMSDNNQAEEVEVEVLSSPHLQVLPPPALPDALDFLSPHGQDLAKFLTQIVATNKHGVEGTGVRLFSALVTDRKRSVHPRRWDLQFERFWASIYSQLIAGNRALLRAERLEKDLHTSRITSEREEKRLYGLVVRLERDLKNASNFLRQAQNEASHARPACFQGFDAKILSHRDCGFIKYCIQVNNTQLYIPHTLSLILSQPHPLSSSFSLLRSFFSSPVHLYKYIYLSFSSSLL
ncbi:hypothetical protein AAMO2058_000921400 [Amorphochlora amoebiformis]